MYSLICLECLVPWFSTKEDTHCVWCGSDAVEELDDTSNAEACGRGICAKAAGHDGDCDY